MLDHVNSNNISGTRYLATTVRGKVPGIKKEKRQGKKEKKRKEKKNEAKTNMRSGRRRSPEGTRLLFAGGTVSPTMCPADGQHKDDKNGPT